MDPQKNSTTPPQDLPTSSPSEQAPQMTPQLSQELLTLLQDPKLQVKYATINAILQHTKSDPQKQLFADTKLFEQLVTNMNNEKLTKICLSTLIHFSSSQKCAQGMIKYCNNFVMSLKNSTGLVEELGLLLLLNLSKIGEFTDWLINQQGNPTEGNAIVLNTLYGFLETKPTRKWVIANIFVNISSHNNGRQYIAKHKLYLKFLQYINDQKQSLRLASIRILRNISFLWQNQQIISQLLQPNHHIIDTISIHILTLILKSKLCPSYEQTIDILKDLNYSNIIDYQIFIEPDLQKMQTTKQKSISEIEICVDVILILSNADFPKRKPQFWKDGLKRMIGLVNFTDVQEEVKDKLEALETFCFW